MRQIKTKQNNTTTMSRFQQLQQPYPTWCPVIDHTAEAKYVFYQHFDPKANYDRVTSYGAFQYHCLCKTHNVIDHKGRTRSQFPKRMLTLRDAVKVCKTYKQIAYSCPHNSGALHTTGPRVNEQTYHNIIFPINVEHLNRTNPAFRNDHPKRKYNYVKETINRMMESNEYLKVADIYMSA